MPIDPRRLPFLLAVARAGGVLAAADDMQMTPSAVSQQIARLEREAECVLVTRTSHGSVLTAEGVVLAEAAQEIERTLLDVKARLDRGDAELQGVMRIGGFASFLSVVIAPALAEWKRQLPGVHFEVQEAEREPMLRALKAGELDAVIIESDAGGPAKALPSGMAEVPLLDEPWKLVVPAGTLVSDAVELGRLSLPWLGVEPGSAGAQAVSRLRRVTGMDQPIVHRYYGTQTALALVAAGEGMALIPLLALKGVYLEGVDTLDVPGLGTRSIVLRSYFRGKQTQNLITAVSGLILGAVAEIPMESGVAAVTS
jgi:DNA-binding transcriptional LysR family regulator